MSRREIFKVYVANRFNVYHKDDLLVSGEELIDKYYGDIEDALNNEGLDMDSIVDFYDAEADCIQIFALQKESLVVRDGNFRGYVLNKGDLYTPDSNTLKKLNEYNEYGEDEFIEGEHFEILGVIHNDVDDTVEYALKCYVEALKPIDITV